MEYLHDTPNVFYYVYYTNRVIDRGCISRTPFTIDETVRTDQSMFSERKRKFTCLRVKIFCPIVTGLITFMTLRV